MNVQSDDHKTFLIHVNETLLSLCFVKFVNFGIKCYKVERIVEFY